MIPVEDITVTDSYKTSGTCTHRHAAASHGPYKTLVHLRHMMLATRAAPHILITVWQLLFAVSMTAVIMEQTEHTWNHSKESRITTEFLHIVQLVVTKVLRLPPAASFPSRCTRNSREAPLSITDNSGCVRSSGWTKGMR